jgi:hypothetical protein
MWEGVRGKKGKWWWELRVFEGATSSSRYVCTEKAEWTPAGVGRRPAILPAYKKPVAAKALTGIDPNPQGYYLHHLRSPDPSFCRIQV